MVAARPRSAPFRPPTAPGSAASCRQRCRGARCTSSTPAPAPGTMAGRTCTAPQGTRPWAAVTPCWRAPSPRATVASSARSRAARTQRPRRPPATPPLAAHTQSALRAACTFTAQRAAACLMQRAGAGPWARARLGRTCAGSSASWGQTCRCRRSRQRRWRRRRRRQEASASAAP